MKVLPLNTVLPQVSSLSYGCMGLGGSDWFSGQYGAEDLKLCNQVMDTLLELGINHLDHADIYKGGKSERIMGEVFRQRPELRAQFFVQSKCGIRFDDHLGPHRYEQNKAWILSSVDASLARLNTDYLDTLLIHRPDPLMEVEEIAEAFELLLSSGKVKYFGVSNMNAPQMQFLQSYLSMPLLVNQLEMSLSELGWINDGILVANPRGAEVNFTAGILEYCRSHGVQLQAWGSLSQGLFSGASLQGQPERIQKTAQKVAHYAALYQVSREAIVLAFIMRHPAQIQPVIGTTSPERIKACSEAQGIYLEREHWYDLLTSSRGERMP